MPLGIGGEAPAGFVERGLLPDTGQDIEQRPARRMMAEGFRGRDQPRAGLVGEFAQHAQAAAILAVEDEAGGEPGPSAALPDGEKGMAELLVRQRPRCEVGDDDRLLAFGMVEKHREIEPAFALRRRLVSEGQESRQPPISRPVPGIDDDIRRSVAKDEPHADREPHVPAPAFLLCLGGHFLRLGMGAYHAGQRVAVRDADARIAELPGTLDIFFRMRGRAEKGEVGRGAEFDEAAHGKSPCRYHFGAMPSRGASL